MQIAMLSWESLHSIAVGGVAAHVTELAAALDRKGHQVHVFTRRAAGQRNHDWIDGVHYHRCAYPPHPDFVDDVNNMCRAMVDRLFEVEDFVGHFDVVHAHDWLTTNAMIWIKQGRSHRCIFTVHSTEYGRCGNSFHSGRSVRIRDQERAGAYWADRVIAVSHAARKEIGWMYEVPDWKTSVVYNAVSAHRFDVPVDPGQVKRRYQIGPVDPTVLFCGRLTHQKGPDLLIEAAPAILRQHPRAKFVFVGDGEMRGSLEARARHLGIGDAVRILGYRNGEELVNLFKMADVVCVPSRNEPFGIVVLEAWAAGKPVVVTQNGGPNEYVRHEENGLKIYPYPESVAWGLSTLFADFDRARRMGEAGRRAVEEQFTWNRIADQTLAVYDPDGPRVAAPASVPDNRAAGLVPAEAATGAAGPPQRPDASLPVSVRLTLKPRGPAASVRGAAAICRATLRASGLRVQSRRGGLRFEAPWEPAVAAVDQCIRALAETTQVEVAATVRFLPRPVATPLPHERQPVPPHRTVAPATEMTGAPACDPAAADAALLATCGS